MKTKINGLSITIAGVKAIVGEKATFYLCRFFNTGKSGENYHSFLEWNSLDGLRYATPFDNDSRVAINNRILIMRYGRDITKFLDLWPVPMLNYLKDMKFEVLDNA